MSANDDPVPRDCVINLDAIEQVPISPLTDRIGRLGPERMHAVCTALGVAVDC